MNTLARFHSMLQLQAVRRQVNRNAQRARQIERLLPAPLKNKVQELSTNLLNLFVSKTKVLPIPMSNCSRPPALL